MSAKRHSIEYLREQGHLRARTNVVGAVTRVRNCLSQAIHRFFHEQGYLWIAAPLITASDTEGAGEMFRVSTLDMENLPRTPEGKVDYDKDFFGKGDLPDRVRPAQRRNLRLRPVQGLHLRADLPRRKLQHQPPPGRVLDGGAGVAFADLEDNAALAEAMLKYVFNAVLVSAATIWSSSPSTWTRTPSAVWSASSPPTSPRLTTPTPSKC
jgi:asparaginyl-tRNA synthetase